MAIFTAADADDDVLALDVAADVELAGAAALLVDLELLELPQPAMASTAVGRIRNANNLRNIASFRL
ncbi:MAG: hypothetical protein M3Y09_19715 [Actinomycetota bacterium]|nr:hypothetical protein [Actinomycetota bacterium]